MRNAISLVQDLNSCRRVHFLRRQPLHHGHPKKLWLGETINLIVQKVSNTRNDWCEQGVSKGIVPEIEIWPYEQIVSAQPRIRYKNFSENLRYKKSLESQKIWPCDN